MRSTRYQEVTDGVAKPGRGDVVGLWLLLLIMLGLFAGLLISMNLMMNVGECVLYGNAPTVSAICPFPGVLKEPG